MNQLVLLPVDTDQGQRVGMADEPDSLDVFLLARRDIKRFQQVRPGFRLFRCHHYLWANNWPRALQDGDLVLQSPRRRTDHWRLTVLLRRHILLWLNQENCARPKNGASNKNQCDFQSVFSGGRNTVIENRHTKIFCRILDC